MQNLIKLYLSYMKLAVFSMLFAAVLFSLYAGIKSNMIAQEIVSFAFSVLSALAISGLAYGIISSQLPHALNVYLVRLLERIIIGLKKRLLS